MCIQFHYRMFLTLSTSDHILLRIFKFVINLHKMYIITTNKHKLMSYPFYAFIFRGLLNQPHSLLKQPQSHVSWSHALSKFDIFYHTQEEEKCFFYTSFFFSSELENFKFE